MNNLDSIVMLLCVLLATSITTTFLLTALLMRMSKTMDYILEKIGEMR